MKCVQHPALDGAPCHYCGGFFCSECSIDLGGRLTCEACKSRALASPSSQPFSASVDPALKLIVPISSNWMAIVAFWVAMLGCIPGVSLVGLALGIVGLREAKTKQEGFWRSVVAIVLAVAWTAVWIAALVAGLVK